MGMTVRRFTDDVSPKMKLAGARSIQDTMNMDNFTERAAACYEAMVEAKRAEQGAPLNGGTFE